MIMAVLFILNKLTGITQKHWGWSQAFRPGDVLGHSLLLGVAAPPPPRRHQAPLCSQPPRSEHPILCGACVQTPGRAHAPPAPPPMELGSCCSNSRQICHQSPVPPLGPCKHKPGIAGLSVPSPAHPLCTGEAGDTRKELPELPPPRTPEPAWATLAGHPPPWFRLPSELQRRSLGGRGSDLPVLAVCGKAWNRSRSASELRVRGISSPFHLKKNN